MSLFSTKIFKKHIIINFLFSSLIVSFIAGNLVLNVNVLLIIVTSFFFYKERIFKFDFDNFDKILIFYFYIFYYAVFSIMLVIIKDSLTDDFSVLLKSLFFLRFLFFYFVVKFLIKENIINFKVFFIISFASVTFVSLDIIYQLIFGYDIFGFKGVERRLSGPFGDELIAGSFIQRFSLISFF